MPAAYELHPVERCNMCGSTEAKVLGRRLSTSQGARPTKRIGVSTTVMRCRACGLVYANPQPTPVDIGQHYDTAPETYWKPRYLDDSTDYFAVQIATFRRLWGQDGPANALDIGAGIGKAMASMTAHGLDAHGLEPSAAFRQAALDSGIPADRLQLASVETASYQPGSFDFATFTAVLEHLADPAGMIERAMSWLRPGGLLHMEVPSSDWLTARIVNTIYRLQGLDYVTNLSPMHPPYHLYEFTPRSFDAHAQRAGHQVAFVRRMTGRDVFLPGPAPAWRWLQQRTGTGMQLEVWLQRTSS